MLEVDRWEGVTVAVAVLVRLEDFRMPGKIDVERWVQQIDDKILPVFGADETAPVVIAIRATERSGKQIAANLILDAAVDCPAQFERSKEERPRRTIADYDAPRGDISN
ncbi:MAG: hypothetical protein HYV04_07580 [Deltaproteobacteria bacterium]|nr:hypothetical protein [Deltaproteobacteria bacterium]